MNRPSRPSGSATPNQGQQQNVFNQQQQNMYNQQMSQMQGNMGNPAYSEQEYNAQRQVKKKSTTKIVLIILGVVVGVALLGVLVYFVGTSRWSSNVTRLENEVAQGKIDYENLENSKNEEIDELYDEIDRLKDAIADTTVLETEKTTSLQTVEGQYVPEYWLLNGEFVSPNEFTLPNSSESVNDTYIMVGQKYTFRPTDRWLITAKGTTLELAHPNHIWGKIRALQIKETITKVEDMKALLQEFFVGYQQAMTITYRSIYLDDKIVGMMANVKITVKYNAAENQAEVKTQADVDAMLDAARSEEPVDGYDIQEKDVYLNIGFVNKSDYALEFLFLHDAENNDTSQELIDLFLRSGTYGPTGSSIKLEQ